MGFYGNIIQGIKDSFFSTVSFKNKENKKDNFSITAEYKGDDLTFNTGDHWLNFSKGENNNEIILSHNEPDEGINRTLTKVEQSNKDNSGALDISEGGSISIHSVGYDSLGHSNKQDEYIDTINLNINTEKNRREQYYNNLKLTIDNNYNTLNNKINTQDNALDILIASDKNKSIREIALDVTDKDTSTMQNAIDTVNNNINIGSQDLINKMSEYANQKLIYTENTELGIISERVMLIANKNPSTQYLEISFKDNPNYKPPL